MGVRCRFGLKTYSLSRKKMTTLPTHAMPYVAPELGLYVLAKEGSSITSPHAGSGGVPMETETVS